MHKLARRINQLAESETLAMTQKSNELKALGHNVINLSLGEPDFNTPEPIKEAAKKALDENFTHYTPVSGFKDLRDAISRKFKTENNLDYSAEEIVVSTGAKQSIVNVVMCLVDPGDEVIVPVPYWVSYKEIIKLAGGEMVFLPSTVENDFKFTAEQLEKAITPRSRLLIYSSPCNPSGSVLTKDELQAISEVIAKYPDLYVVSDEIYEHINYIGKHESIAQFEKIKDRVITINGVSKGYAMTGWRVGYIGAPKWIAQACDKLQGQVTSGTCSIAQKAATAALNTGAEFYSEMCKVFKSRRDLMLKLMKEIPGVKTNTPAGAFYVFADVSYYFGKSKGNYSIKSPNDISMYLLNEAYVASVSGEAFGDSNCIRLSYATSDNLIIEAVERIHKALNELK